MTRIEAPGLMGRALELAERGRNSTHPNPRVGCVIARENEIVGEGWHERAGGPHAEIVALRAAGDKARGATAYLTLEPCNHQGRTPPCTDALLQAGVESVVVAMEDPNPLVAGKGIAVLQAAGIEVVVGLMGQQAEKLNRGFISRMTRGRPHVILKMAASLDGRTATGSGESRWISSDEAREEVHALRAECGAVLTSVATVLADDPAMTVRSGKVPRQPDRIVLDTKLRSPANAKVWAAGARRIALAVRPAADRVNALRDLGVEVQLVGTDAQGRVDPRSALDMLGRMEVNEVLVECGPTLAGALLAADCVDELRLYLAPSLLGHEGRAMAELPGLEKLDQRLQLRYTQVRRVGPDICVHAVPESR